MKFHLEVHPMRRAARRRSGPTATPWRRIANDTWYVWVDGRQVSLGVKGKRNRNLAEQKWHEMMAVANAHDAGDDNTIRTVFCTYLDYVEKNRSKKTYYDYRWFLRSFAKLYRSLPVGELRPRHVQAWLESHPDWNDTTRWTAISRVMACLNWASKATVGLTSRNPLRGMERPSPHSRGVEALIDDEDYDKVYRAAKPAARDVVLMLRHTGARPSEIFRATAKDFDDRSRALILAEHKSKRKVHRRRVINLDLTAYNLVRGLVQARPEGPLFRTQRGHPWTAARLARVLRQLCESLGLRKRITAYGFRHTWATEALAGGHPDADVAAALGHSSTAMLYKHYNHLVAKAGRVRAMVDAVIKPARCEAPDPGRATEHDASSR
jgi:integrase